MISRCLLLALLCAPAGLASAAPAFRLEHSVVLTSPPELHWAQSRAALIPGAPTRVLLTTQQIEKAGAHGYRDVFVTESTDGAKSWSRPTPIPSLARQRMPEGHDFVMGDICPQWHAATRVVLATGKTFGFDGGVKENRGFERVSYAVFNPTNNQWSGLKLLALPEKDHEGKTILEPNAGCHQRWDLPNGEILLPIRYRKDPASRVYTTIVARCTFDGETLTYRGHGSEFNVPKPRGLYEPSVCSFQGRYFLTMRAEETGYVARGKDGIHFEPPVEWAFDDGQPLGSYNTQQHWIVHSGGLWLIYTRRGANNDHVFRHRAPIFIARVDPDGLRVLRATEQVLLPETGLDLGGGFAPVDVSANETWVVSTEMAFPKARIHEPNRVRLAKIFWAEPNKLFPSANMPAKPTVR